MVSNSNVDNSRWEIPALSNFGSIDKQSTQTERKSLDDIV